MRALGKMFGRAGARGWYAARAVSASARAAGDAFGGPRAFVSVRVEIPRFVSHVVSRTTSSRPFSGPAARRPQPRPRGFASAGTPRDDRDATAVETDASATGERDAVETEKKAPVTDASTPTPSPRVPLDGTSSTETDGVHAVKVVQNTWWEALTMTPVYAFRATRAKWASAPAVAAAIDPGFDADVFSRLAAVGRDEVLRAYAANDMSRVREMCTPAVFDAFQQSRIEYERNNLALRYDRAPSADEETSASDAPERENETPLDALDSEMCSARLIDLRLARQEDTFTGEPEDDPVWVARRDRCRAFVNGVGSGAREATSVGDGRTLAPEKTQTTFESLESADAKPLRLVATVFVMDKTGSRWSIEDTVNGTVGITEDLRIQEWSFTRDLPRYWPSDEALETPWRVEHIG